jgi:hypothetical protein
MNNLSEAAFFDVISNNDLWILIKSFMCPGMKTSTYSNYKSGDLAAKHGYLSLIIERGNELEFSADAMDWAAGNGHIEVVKWLQQRLKRRVRRS